jgi:ATP-dependent RNA helicase CshB
MIESLSVQPHIVIGTVGRLKDLFVDENVLRLDNAYTVVIDEADMTLEMGFIDEVDMILGKLNRRLQIAVFSATVPDQLQAFLRRYMYRPVIIEAKEASPLNPQIEHVLVNCRYSSYQEKLLKILPGINPYVCMIFAKTKKEVIDTSRLLKDNGYDVVEIHGDLKDRERKQALKAIGTDAASYIVCSDIMARGLDIESVSHVISLGLPSNLDYYTHRCGRTGRSGRTGTSYILFTSGDIPALRTLKEKFTFVSRDYRRGEWVEARDFDFRPRRHSKEASSEIQMIRNRPVKQVKPGYRKKRKAAIESIERRERRLAIKQKIREEQKERAKKAQRQKGGY